MPRKALYVEKTEVQLKQWAAKLEELRRKVEKGSAEAEADLLRALGELKTREAAIRDVIKEIRAAGGESWRDAKAGLESAWDDVKGTYEMAKASLGMAPKRRASAAKPMRKAAAKAKPRATPRARAKPRATTGRTRRTTRAAR